MYITVAGADRCAKIPIELGDELRLVFRHSLYGSLVQELFIAEQCGLRLTHLLYEEPRTAEYYGHDNAERNGDWWSVPGNGVLHTSIVLRVIPESEMTLGTDEIHFPLNELLPVGGVVQISTEN